MRERQRQREIKVALRTYTLELHEINLIFMHCCILRSPRNYKETPMVFEVFK